VKEIEGALKSAIDAHGPITKELIPSAAKRIAGALSSRRAAVNGSKERKIATEILRKLDKCGSYFVWTKPKNVNDVRVPERFPRVVCTAAELRFLVRKVLTRKEPQ
jgi:hypothetical protein